MLPLYVAPSSRLFIQMRNTISAQRAVGTVSVEQEGEGMEVNVQVGGQAVKVSISAETKIEGLEPARGIVQRAVMSSCVMLK